MANLSFAVSQRRSRQRNAQKARTRQGADVQLPADIQPNNHLEGDRTAGARQAAGTPALISKLLTTAVSVLARALHRDGITAPHEHGVCRPRCACQHLESQFGVVGAASSWLRSYLRGRQQFVRLGRHSSPMTQCDCGVPQGSVLGLLLFTAYVSAIGELIESYGVSYHQFADDTQLLVNMDSTNAMPAIDRLAHCSATVRLWFLQNGLQLNADKSEVVLLGPPAQLRSTTNITTVDVARSTLPVALKLKSLGMTTDSNLRFDCHARNVAKACNFHTRALRHVCSLLTDDVAQTAACSIVASRLDYCNALLSGTPVATFDNLQRAQNTWPESSARAGVAPTPGRCFTRYTGFR